MTDIYLALLCSAYLLYMGPDGYGQITRHKGEAYLILTGIYLLAALLVRLELAAVGRRQKLKPVSWLKETSPAQKAVMLYLAFTALSTVLSPYRQTAFWGGGRCEGLLAIAMYVLVFLVVSSRKRPAGWVFLPAALAMGANCLLAFAQFGGFNPLTLYPAGMTYYDANVRYAGAFLGTIGNVDILDAFSRHQPV
ncbi:MAG: hypothetical protein K5981_00530 [Clostridia bacterium]|nr:hypothetical protein [Clostridia bacterium]